MPKSIPFVLIVLISLSAATKQATINTEIARPPAKGHRQHWLTDAPRSRNDVLKKWLENKKVEKPSDGNLKSSPFDLLHPPQQFKGICYSNNSKFSFRQTKFRLGCIDPSEPFQCPRSDRCIALQFICDGHPGDCPENLDENEETCIAGKVNFLVGKKKIFVILAKRPAKDNIEKFFHASYTLHGLELFTFLFGERLAKNIQENHAFWFDTLASAFSGKVLVFLF
jgi:hypothetical protein